jgi:hypothetical protein
MPTAHERSFVPRCAAALTLAIASIGLHACSDSEADPSPTTAPGTTTPGTTTPGTTVPPVQLEQLAIWPRADVVFTSPEEAATDAVRQLFGVPAVLGEFMRGDLRSGEIEVLSSGEGQTLVRSLLLLRQLGPNNGWFVIGAIHPEITITSPQSGAGVPRGPVTVTGTARGYEGTVVVTAYVSGDVSRVIDQVVITGEQSQDAQPFSVQIDLSDIATGESVTLVVRGDTGLSEDTGEFSAIALRVESY